MSHKRRKQNSADARWFVYAPGSVVPRDATHVLVHHSVEVLPARAFQTYRRLKEVQLPEGLRHIGACAFGSCTSLEHVTLPSTLKKIAQGAFANCTSLRELVFPEGIAVIDRSAFRDCTSLKRISVSSTVATIGDDAFESCTVLKVVRLADGIRTIGRSAFQGCALEDIILPATLTLIGDSAFNRCRPLRMVKLCGGIQKISANAFSDCPLLDHVVVPTNALIVTDTQETPHFYFASEGTFSPRNSTQVVISSEGFNSVRADEMSEVELGVTGILGLEEARERLHAFLAPYELRHKKRATTLLELGLWKAQLEASQGADAGLGREDCRVNCGAAIIVPRVLLFL